MTDGPREDGSAGVPARAKQAEEAERGRGERWGWVEPEVWTARMLAALDEGVKGGRWYSLLDKVYAERTLAAAWRRVQRNQGSAGVDRQRVQAFGARAEEYLREIAGEPRAGTYRPEPVRRVWIPKPGRAERRPLGIPTVKDRVVQTALKLVLEPIWEARFAEQSDGFRPRRGCKDALRRVDALLTDGATWVVEVDLERYFGTIPHEPLVTLVEQRVSDGGVVKLLRAYLTQGVLDGLEQWSPERGSPQGAVISPMLANVYLDGLDHRMAAQGYQLVRYADDMVVLCRSDAEAEAALGELTAWVHAHGLTLHPEKTRLVDATQAGGFDVLGYHFERGKKWPSRRRVGKLPDAIRAKTGRTVSGSLDQIIGAINPILRGWFGYFKHSHRTTFSGLDGWVRMRLRSILRKRRKGHGRARNPDQQRWPNASFVSHGCFTMQTARLHAIRALAAQPR